MDSDETLRILALEGVQAVCDGLGPDGAPCRRILVRSLAELRVSLPDVLDGLPVEVRECGPLGPREGA
jgi:hypothetical protein